MIQRSRFRGDDGRDVMQPWDNVITLKETCSIEEAIETVIQHQFSRLPSGERTNQQLLELS